MKVEIGNDQALEGYRDPQGEDPDLVLYRAAPGQRTTTLKVPDGMGLSEAFTSITAALKKHMSEDATPVWIESDSAGLQALLEEHYGLSKAQAKRPARWGNEGGQ